MENHRHTRLLFKAVFVRQRRNDEGGVWGVKSTMGKTCSELRKLIDIE